MLPVAIVVIAWAVLRMATTEAPRKPFSILKVGATPSRTAPPTNLVWDPYTQSWSRPRAPGYAQPYGQPPTPNLDALNQLLLQGMQAPPQLLQLAYQEAVTTGDYQSAQLIQQIAANPVQQVGAVVGGDDDGGDAEKAQAKFEAMSAEDGDLGPVAATTRTTHHRKETPALPPPIDGVEPDEWQAFTKALHTKDPSYRSDRHLGAYEHHRQRLRALGVPESQVTTEDGQYQALCTDIADYSKRCEALIRDYTGDAVDVNGQVHPITMSGVLGILKAAGPAGAAGWLQNPEDRTKFPRTTDTFLRTNNCF